MFNDGFSTGMDVANLISMALSIALGIIVLVFVVLGLILAYHWRKYSYNLVAAWLFQVFYWGLGGLLVVILGVAAVTFAS